MDKEQFFRLTDGVVIFVVSLITYIGLNFKVMLQAITKEDEKTLSYVDDLVYSVQEKIPTWIVDLFLSPSIATFVLWALLGMFCYTIISKIGDETGSFMERLAVSFRYVHPRNFKQEKFWIYNLVEVLLSILFVFVLVGWAWLSVKIFIPFSSYMLLIGIYDSSSVASSTGRIVLGFICVLMVFTGLYLIFKLTRLIQQRFA